jgi:hypothetical protein
MSAFEELWQNGRLGLRPAVSTDSAQPERQRDSAARSWAEAALQFKTWVGDRPALAVGTAFIAGVTLGWMIKRW